MSMSISSVSLSNTSTASWSSKSKQNSMHEFIRAVREYHKNRGDESVQLINRHLQMLGVSIDTSIFDPNTSVVCEFFVSMYELLSIIEPRSALAWGCVNVLQTTCKNQSARHQLIHTYQFIPLLSRILAEHLALEKKIRLLTVIQELSCGVKISWIIPNLEHLMLTLLKWIQNENENKKIVLLSLGIIINLCFKNLPATYMLSKCVDIKKFLMFLGTLKGVKLDACTCKLYIILDYIHGIVPGITFIKLLEVTFKSVKESFIANDPILLRQNIEFYLDVKVDGQDLHHVINEDMKDYPERVNDIMLMINHESMDTNDKTAGDGLVYDPECMSLIFKFLKSIVDWNLPHLEQFHKSMTLIAVNWIQTEVVASDALSLLKSIVLSSQQHNTAVANLQIVEAILSSMQILILNVQHIEMDTIMNIDQCARLSNIMELLKILVETPKSRDHVIGYLSQELLAKIFNLAIGKPSNNVAEPMSQNGRANDANNFTPEAFTLYINTLSLLNSIAHFYSDWQPYLNSILANKQMQAILAESLYTGSKETRVCVLQMIAGNGHFPCEAIAGTMDEVCKHAPIAGIGSTSTSSSIMYPSKSVVQDNTLCYQLVNSYSMVPDNAIRKLNEARTSQRINISTCDVMELYEYKIATMGHAERSAMASVEAASARCTQLQHQVAQLTAELSRIRQLFLHTQQVQQETDKLVSKLGAELRDEKGQRKQFQDELAKLKEELSRRVKQIEELTKVQQELQLEKDKALQVIPQMQDSLKKMEKLSERKEEAIKALQFELQTVKKNQSETEAHLHDALKDSDNLRHLFETITKLTTNGLQK